MAVDKRLNQMLDMSNMLDALERAVIDEFELRGAPSGHTVNIREVRLAAGAQFIVMICGDIMTMPGLPKVPSAVKIDIDETGKVVGLF